MIASDLVRARALGAFAVGAIVLAASAARADDKAAAAEVLFEEAKRLVAQGDYAHACPKLEESQKLDPGVGTLYRLGDCYEHVGRTASAWAAFREVAASTKSAGQQARAEDARKRAEALERSLARCEIKVAAPETPGLVVKRGGAEIGRGQWNVALPVDPGELVVQASAPGRRPYSVTAAAVAQSVTRIEVPALEVQPEPATAPSTGAVGAPLPPPAQDREDPGATQRTVGFALGAAGVVGLGLGSVFGLVSMSKKGDADGHCDAANTCDDEGLGLRRDAISTGNVSTIAFIAGGVLVAGGAALWLTAPKRPGGMRAAIVPRGAGLGLRVEVP